MMTGTISMEARLGPVSAPGYAARMRAALAPAVRTKLEALEQDAAAAHAAVLVASDRTREAAEALRILKSRDAELRALHPELRPGRWVPDPSCGPTAKVWEPAVGDNLSDLARDIARLTDDVARLTGVRDAAEARWRAGSQVAERAREYLGVPAA